MYFRKSSPRQNRSTIKTQKYNFIKSLTFLSSKKPDVCGCLYSGHMQN